jgi:hypothetical protein
MRARLIRALGGLHGNEKKIIFSWSSGGEMADPATVWWILYIHPYTNHHSMA